MSNYEAQAQLLWESVLDMMAPLCAKDDMTVLRSLALRAQSEKQWTLLAPNKFACEQIKKSLFMTLDMALRNKGIKEVKLEARKIAKRLHLEMKITDIEYQGDGTKITFYYTADGRVDFRQLIKEYANAFRAKVDMKQIGYRQETAKIGGIGSCGRELCCSTWLTDFRSVNTNAARYQQLSINPVKLTGQCGKLKCCLNFELDSYIDALSHFPSSSTILNTEKGKAFCIKIDVFKKRMWFAYVDNSMLWYDLDIEEVKKLIAVNKQGDKIPPLEELKSQIISSISNGADLIQENSIDRFEKKKNNHKRQKKNQNTEKKENTNTAENKKEQKPKNSNRKFNKKKNPPRKDNNNE